MGPLKHQLFSSFLGGQFGPVCTGQFEPVKGGQFQPARVVNLNRILHLTTNTIVVNVLITLQVKELKETALQIFPNPVKDILNIVNQHIAALGKIELINARGKVLETKTISTSTYTWNLQHLPAGTYILRGQGWGQKVVKE